MFHTLRFLFDLVETHLLCEIHQLLFDRDLGEEVIDVEVIDREALCSLDWIDGEAVPRGFVVGETVPAGAFNVGSHAFIGKTQTDFSRSSIVSLLRGGERELSGSGASHWWSRVAKFYVAGVLALASACMVFARCPITGKENSPSPCSVFREEFLSLFQQRLRLNL